MAASRIRPLFARRKRARTRVRRRLFRPGVEGLEDRRMLTLFGLPSVTILITINVPDLGSIFSVARGTALLEIDEENVTDLDGDGKEEVAVSLYDFQQDDDISFVAQEGIGLELTLIGGPIGETFSGGIFEEMTNTNPGEIDFPGEYILKVFPRVEVTDPAGNQQIIQTLPDTPVQLFGTASSVPFGTDEFASRPTFIPEPLDNGAELREFTIVPRDAPPDTPEPTTGSIHGDVIEFKSGGGGRGLPGVSMELEEFIINESTSTVTDENGEFWFDDVRPGDYELTQLPDERLLASALLGRSLFRVRAGVELVARPKQAKIPHGDPRVERVVERNDITFRHPLVFSTVVKGSIHGIVFNDTENLGVQDPEESLLAGVKIRLLREDPAPVAGLPPVLTQVDSVLTNADGEYWFNNVDPESEYRVAPVLPPGMTQTTVARQEPISFRNEIGARISGLEFVGTAEQFSTILNEHHGPVRGIVELAFGAQGEAPVRVEVEGDATVRMLNPPFPLRDEDGFAAAVPEGQEVVIDFELVSFNLHGVLPSTCEQLTLRLNDDFPSVGQLQVQNVGGELTGNHFFDLFAEIEVEGDQSTPVVNKEPFRLGKTYTSDDNIPAKSVLAVPLSVSAEDLPRPLVNNDGQRWGELIGLDLEPLSIFVHPVRPQLLEGLVFGLRTDEVAPGSIHGHKFEDLNADGEDEEGQDPPLADVAITLVGTDTAGNVIGPITVVTNAQGDYWFEDLPPGTYTITEDPPEGSIATTAPSYTVPELLPGQAIVSRSLQPSPHPNELVDPGLAFGNTFPGSIHGLKFEDLDGDGMRGPDEPPMEGIEIRLLGSDESRVTSTDANGEFWFTELDPGQSYTVREVRPPGTIQTTEDPMPILISSGQEHVATSEQREAVGMEIRFPDRIVVNPDLAIGNITLLGAIHGFKFEDLNADGDDENGLDPPLGGVSITLTGTDIAGNAVGPITTVTDNNGE